MLKTGVALVAVLLSGLANAHGHHHHKDVLDRVMHKAPVSILDSGNSRKARSILVGGASCSPSTAFQSIRSPHISSVPQVKDMSLEQEQASLSTTLGRSRHFINTKKGTLNPSIDGLDVLSSDIYDSRFLSLTAAKQWLPPRLLPRALTPPRRSIPSPTLPNYRTSTLFSKRRSKATSYQKSLGVKRRLSNPFH